MFRVERPPKEPNAVVIFPPDGSMPAYIPNCAEYSFRMLQKLAAAQHSVQPTPSGRGDSARSRVRKNKSILPAKSG